MAQLKNLLVLGAMRVINTIKGSITHAQNGMYYGTCSTAAGTAAKVVELVDPTGFELRPGIMIAVKFSATNTATSCTLNVEGTGAKQVWYNNAVYTSASTDIFGYANRVYHYVYDGTYWSWMGKGVDNDSNTLPSAQCETAAATAAKAATITNYTLTANTYLHFNIRYANTVAGAITMNVNSKGAKPIYINGSASSSSNHTLPAGTYIAFYNGTYWDFRTDGRLPRYEFVVTPEMYGAKGDGTTDDTAAVQNAFNDSAYFVYLPKTYLITGELTITVPHEINGGHLLWRNTTSWTDRSWDGSAWTHVIKNAITISAVGVVIKNFELSSDRSNTSIKTWTGIHSNYSNCTFDNIKVSGFKWSGISIYGVDSKVINSVFEEDRYGIVNNSTNTTIDNNTVNGKFIESSEYATYGTWKSETSTFESDYYDGILNGSSAVYATITNNHVMNCGQGGIYSSGARNIVIANNYVHDNFGSGIDNGATGSHTNEYFDIHNNIVENNRMRQMVISLCNNFVVENNILRVSLSSHTEPPIVIHETSTYCNFISNKIVGNGSTIRGISLPDATSNCLFDNNEFENVLVDYNVTQTILNNNTFLNRNFRIINNKQFTIAKSSNITININDYVAVSNTTTSKQFLFTGIGQNQAWRFSGILNIAGSSGGTSNFVAFEQSNCTVTVSGHTITLANTNASYAATMNLSLIYLTAYNGFNIF